MDNTPPLTATPAAKTTAQAATNRWQAAAWATLGAGSCIGLLAGLQEMLMQNLSWSLLLMAPFGATMVLLYALPQSPLAQPKNIFFGHLLTCALGLLLLHTLGVSPLTLGLGTGLGVGLMMLTNTTHPPAGANPLLVMLAGAEWQFLLTPVVSGLLLILAFGWAYHKSLYIKGISKHSWPKTN
ncbi:HPP family protein [Shewanella algae]|uniref:HPP family protein n=1 Tax=Shewanella algae TaxID=38313 RepID=UPI0016426E31|nr:HPP family protein [Shewanella algae]